MNTTKSGICARYMHFMHISQKYIHEMGFSCTYPPRHVHEMPILCTDARARNYHTFILLYDSEKSPNLKNDPAPYNRGNGRDFSALDSKGNAPKPPNFGRLTHKKAPAARLANCGGVVFIGGGIGGCALRGCRN